MAVTTSPRSAVRWLSDSFQVLRAQPVAYTGVVLFSLLASGILSSLPLIGLLLASLWMPYGTVLTGLGARDALEGKAPSYGVIGKAFADKTVRGRFFAIGMLSAVWLEIVSAVFAMLGREQIAQWQVTAEGVDLASIYTNFPTTATAAAFALYVPLLMLTAFSPLLVALNRQPFGKSLFYSFFGALRHLPAILVYLVVLLLGATLFTLGLEALFAVLGMASAVAFLAPILMAALSAVSQAGVWAMFRDIFGETRIER